MAGYLNRHRASMIMREQGLSALVLAQPETIQYVTGAFAGVASFWRRAGAAFVVVPADADAPLAAIVGDLQARSFARQSGIADVRSHPIWVETDRYPEPDLSKPKRTPRPATFEISNSMALLGDVLAERGLAKSSIGLELGFIPAADFPAFATIDVKWQDCTRIVERLRSIKHADEISKLRLAAELAVAGRNRLIESIRAGQTSQEMVEIWKRAVAAVATQEGQPQPQSTWAYISVGSDGFAPGGCAQYGDIIKIDVGCVIDGYSSDGARSVALGKPHPQAMKIYDDLHRAFDAGLAQIKPGAQLSDIYFATATSMWNAGHEAYGRGHFGHGVGSSVWSEEWPFISAVADAIVEPDMVLAFETPWYIDGLGGFIIEDQVLVTTTGIEVMAPAPRALRVPGIQVQK
jgi:Xaa-Pro dipeptidase